MRRRLFRPLLLSLMRLARLASVVLSALALLPALLPVYPLAPLRLCLATGLVLPGTEMATTDSAVPVLGGLTLGWECLLVSNGFGGG